MKHRLLVCVVTFVCALPLALAQDAVKVDGKHYKVETENAQVRVLRVHYGPHEKSVMHKHPATVAVFLTDADAQFTFPDGKKQTVKVKAGETQYSEPTTHLPENTSDKPFDVIVIELKGGSAKPTATNAKK
jgi:quercetin dioxygenase-like cupin family protein